MKVLVTGASGFVGSHVLDSLAAGGLPRAALLRPSSSRRLLEVTPAGWEARLGTLSDPASLDAALEGITHVIHCAGATKALRPADFYAVNEAGTLRLVEAINRRPGQIARLIHLSSQAAGGPALPDRPAREEDPPRPVSEYGRSKLAGEEAVRQFCRSEHVILRPSAVYGPRDSEFLRLFQAARSHLHPVVRAQPLSLVYGPDLAAAAVACLVPPAAAGRTYYVASAERTDARALAAQVAAEVGGWTLSFPVPTPALWPVCAAAEAAARLTGKPSVLSLQKYAELRAAGWVCDSGRLERELGLVCATPLAAGLAQTLAWYRRHGWL